MKKLIFLIPLFFMCSKVDPLGYGTESDPRTWEQPSKISSPYLPPSDYQGDYREWLDSQYESGKLPIRPDTLSNPGN